MDDIAAVAASSLVPAADKGATLAWVRPRRPDVVAFVTVGAEILWREAFLDSSSGARPAAPAATR